MKKLYTCTIDGKTFGTKDELMEYMEKYFITESESNTVSEYYNKLIEAFPDTAIEIKEEKDSEYGEFYVSIHFNKVGAYFEFYVGKYEECSYDVSQFKTIEEAIKNYNVYPEVTQQIKEEVLRIYDVQKFEVDQWHEATYDGHSYILVESILNDKEVWIRYEFDGIENLMKRIASNFVTEIEGKIDIYFDHTDNSEVFDVDNIDVKGFLKGHKKARITIIE